MMHGQKNIKFINCSRWSCNITVRYCSRSFWYSCLLGLLAPVTDVLSTYVQEPLAIGRRGYEKTLATESGKQSRTRATWGREYKWLCYFNKIWFSCL